MDKADVDRYRRRPQFKTLLRRAPVCLPAGIPTADGFGSGLLLEVAWRGLLSTTQPLCQARVS